MLRGKSFKECWGKDLRMAVHQTVGAASMCYETIPKDIYDDMLACEIAQELIDWIKENYKPIR